MSFKAPTAQELLEFLARPEDEDVVEVRRGDHTMKFRIRAMTFVQQYEIMRLAAVDMETPEEEVEQQRKCSMLTFKYGVMEPELDDEQAERMAAALGFDEFNRVTDAIGALNKSEDDEEDGTDDGEADDPVKSSGDEQPGA